MATDGIVHSWTLNNCHYGAITYDGLQVQPLHQEVANQKCLMVRVDFRWVEAEPWLQWLLALEYCICTICM